MTALPASNPKTFDHATPRDLANHWLERNHTDLIRLARFTHASLDWDAREEAVAETVAYTAKAVHGATRNGTLQTLTPSTCVHYAAIHVRQGRQAAGTSSQCVLSKACRLKHGTKVVSLDDDTRDTDVEVDYHEAVADPKADQPIDAARRRLDFPRILNREAVSSKARATLCFLAETHGSGKQTELASDLMLSPARITQLKAELAHALATDGYHGPLGRRPRQA